MPTFQDIGKQAAAKREGIWTPEAFERLYKMIDYGIRRQDWYEDQRNKVLSLAIGLLGLSSFLVAGLLNSAAQELIWFRIFGGLTIISVVATALLIVLEYARGAQEQYTHRGLADIRSWFFAYVVSADVADAAIFDPRRNDQNKETLVAAWQKFVDGWMVYQGSDAGRGIEDLQQVFILYLFQAIRRKSLRAMVGYAVRGGAVIGVLLIPTVICAALRV